MQEEKLREFIEGICEYTLNERGDTITGLIQVQEGDLRRFELHGTIARDVHRLRVRWEDK